MTTRRLPAFAPYLMLRAGTRGLTGPPPPRRGGHLGVGDRAWRDTPRTVPALPPRGGRRRRDARLLLRLRDRPSLGGAGRAVRRNAVPHNGRTLAGTDAATQGRGLSS